MGTNGYITIILPLIYRGYMMIYSQFLRVPPFFFHETMGSPPSPGDPHLQVPDVGSRAAVGAVGGRISRDLGVPMERRHSNYAG
jgi:hypothetical protein